jgi:hypothetical protein
MHRALLIPEIRAAIFAHLDTMAELFNAMLTCRAWFASAVRFLWREPTSEALARRYVSDDARRLLYCDAISSAACG